MKKAIKVLLVIAVVISLSSFAYSAPGFYVGGNVGIALLSDSDIASSDIPVSITVSSENGFSTGGFIGYSFMNNFRIEGELVYQGNDADKMSISGYDLNLTGDITSVALFANGYYDFKNSSNFTPFVGAGIGMANVEISDFNIVGVGGGDLNDDDTVLAYHLDAGVGYEINERLTLDLKYRYFAADDPEFDGADVEYSSHNIYTGLRVSF